MMELLLRRAVEQDAPALADIILSNPSDLNTALLPNGITADVRRASGNKQRACMKRPGTIMTVACRRDKPEQILGFARWRIQEGSEAAHDNGLLSKKDTESTTTVNMSLQEVFSQKLAEGRARHTAGRRHILLSNLFVHPDHHKQGIGARLLEDGLATGDAQGLLDYLESSPVAKKLYMRYGFEEVDSFTVDLAQGRSSPKLYRTSLMIREAKDAVHK